MWVADHHEILAMDRSNKIADLKETKIIIHQRELKADQHILHLVIVAEVVVHQVVEVMVEVQEDLEAAEVR